ncbi:hypothetical protein GCM10027167_59490 [Nocardia heshunensis]
MSVARHISSVTGTALAAMTLAAAVAGSAHAAPGSYGTLALSRLKNSAVAESETSKVAADAAAIRSCSYYDCEIVLRFTDGCGAVVQGADGTWGWAVGGSLDEAQQNAITSLGQSAPPFPDLGSAQPVAAHVVASTCTKDYQ